MSRSTIFRFIDITIHKSIRFDTTVIFNDRIVFLPQRFQFVNGRDRISRKPFPLRFKTFHCDKFGCIPQPSGFPERVPFSECDFNTGISRIGNQQQTGIWIISQETLFTATRFKNKSFQIGITLRRIIQSYCPNFIRIKFLYPSKYWGHNDSWHPMSSCKTRHSPKRQALDRLHEIRPNILLVRHNSNGEHLDRTKPCVRPM